MFDLGMQPPANSLRENAETEVPRIPLAISRCSSCSTVQLSHTVDPSYLFSDYVWVTGTSRGAVEHSERFCSEAEARARSGTLAVLEIASNDGTFLKRFAAHGHSVLGVDPAQNLARMAEDAGIPTRPEFFSLDFARELRAGIGPFDVIIARNVLPHVPDPADVAAGIANCLAADGLAAIEFHRADVILEDLHYDSIYHEHVFYYSLHSMQSLFARNGLHAFDILESPISGGSYVAYFSPTPRPPTIELRRALQREDKLGVDTRHAWKNFAERCEDHRRKFLELLDKAQAVGGRTVGYGASARSATLLNFCGIGRDRLECIADASALKHGRYAPGSNLRIEAPEKVFAKPVGTVVLLAWNFEAEIVARIRGEFGFKGDVVLPLPREPRVLKV